MTAGAGGRSFRGRRGDPAAGGGRGERAARRSSDRRSVDGAAADPVATDVEAASAELDADPQSVARAICLRQLTMGPRSRAQLAEALRRRNVPDDAAEAVLDRFTEVGLVDDAAFASAWVQSRHTGRGLARRALAHELSTRGVRGDTATAALDELTADDELATARALVARRLGSTARLPAPVRARRLAGMLARKGYPGGVAAEVVREALAAEGDDEPAAIAALADDDGDVGSDGRDSLVPAD